MEEALTTFLLANSGVSTAIGTNLYWGARPQGSGIPAVTLNRISGVRDYVNEGPSGFVASRIQIDCEATTYLGAKQIARDMVRAFDATPTTVGGIQLQGGFVDGERDLFEFDAETNTAIKPFAVSIDVTLYHSE